MWKSFALERRGECSEVADECIGPLRAIQNGIGKHKPTYHYQRCRWVQIRQLCRFEPSKRTTCCRLTCHPPNGLEHLYRAESGR
jgi:hypothetical protein